MNTSDTNPTAEPIHSSAPAHPTTTTNNQEPTAKNQQPQTSDSPTPSNLPTDSPQDPLKLWELMRDDPNAAKHNATTRVLSNPRSSIWDLV